MTDPAWWVSLWQSFGTGGAVGGLALLVALLDRWAGRRDGALKHIDDQEAALRKNLIDDLARVRGELKDAQESLDRAHIDLARWRRCARRLDDWAHQARHKANNIIMGLTLRLGLAPEDVPKLAEVPILETLMDPSPPASPGLPRIPPCSTS